MSRSSHKVEPTTGFGGGGSMYSLPVQVSTYFRVIDGRRRNTLLQEQLFSISGCADESCLSEVGRILTKDKIVVGNLGKIVNCCLLNTG